MTILKDYNLTYNDIIKGGWKYCCGDSKHHKKYFELQTFYKCDKPPASVGICVCGHKIIENCYITDETNISMRKLLHKTMYPKKRKNM